MAREVNSGKVIVKGPPSVRLYTRVRETPVKQEIRLRKVHVRVEHHAVP
jgi:hypothetical protein